MALLEFIVTVIVITASGALAPGPLFFATLLKGAEGGARAGFSISIGHTIVEVPIVVVIALGLFSLLGKPFLWNIVSLVGGAVLIWFGLKQLTMALSKKSNDEPKSSRFSNPIMLGIALSGLNPFFILWWVSIGSKLVLDALILAALGGVFIMYVAHVWMDYAWLSFVAHAARKGVSITSKRSYRWILASFALVLVYFGVGFVLLPLGIRII